MHQATVSLGSCQNIRARFELAEYMLKFHLVPLYYAYRPACTLQTIKTRTWRLPGVE